MTNLPPSFDPADNPSSEPADESVTDTPIDSVGEADGMAPLSSDGSNEPTGDEPAAAADEADMAVTTPNLTDALPATSTMSDEELLAAADASLHDEGHMVNPSLGPDGSDPAPRSDPHAMGTEPTQGAPSQPPPPPPGQHGYPPAAPMRRLYRSRHDRKLGGVSAGIAEFFRIDPTVVRLATLVAAITGIGVLVYIAAWFIIPLRPDGYVEPGRASPVANERTMTLAFGVATLALAFGIITGSWALLAIALIGGGVWLLSEHTAIAPSFAGQPPVSGAANYQPPVHGYEPGYPPQPYGAPGTFAPTSTGTGFVPPVPAAPIAPKERQPQHVTWTVLSLLALLFAVGTAAATGDWWDVSGTRLLGIGVVIIGVGVVVGQIRRGGARGLIPLGILCALALFPVSAVDGLLTDGIGEATYRPTTIAELENSYDHGIGQLVVDLSELDFEGRSESIDIDLGIGELIVIVSEDTGGQAVIEATAGEVSRELPGTNAVVYEEGVNVKTATIMLDGENGTVNLNIAVGLGTAELRTEAN